MSTFDVQAIRAQFPILSREVNGKPLAYFDSAASAHKPQAVIDAQSRYLAHTHSNIHRGVHALAQEATEAYEAAREKVRAHIGASSTKEILFVGGTTDGINLVAQTWGRTNLGAGDCIVLTRMEHHSNIVPWQMLALEQGFDILVVELNEDGTLDGEMFEAHLARNPKLVAFTHVSNALGHRERRQALDLTCPRCRSDGARGRGTIGPAFARQRARLGCGFLHVQWPQDLRPHGHWGFVRQRGPA